MLGEDEISCRTMISAVWICELGCSIEPQSYKISYWASKFAESNGISCWDMQKSAVGKMRTAVEML